jgi:hypothetical protein
MIYGIRGLGPGPLAASMLALYGERTWVVWVAHPARLHPDALTGSDAPSRSRAGVLKQKEEGLTWRHHPILLRSAWSR